MESSFCCVKLLLVSQVSCIHVGATICLLMDLLEGGHGQFPEIEFRLSNGLPLQAPIKSGQNHLVKETKADLCVGDLLIRRPIGKLTHLPDPKECPIQNLTCIPLAQENTVYTGYNSNVINSSMRMIAVSSDGSNPVLEKLKQGHEWYRKNLKYVMI